MRDLIDILADALFMDEYTSAPPWRQLQMRCPNGNVIFAFSIATCHGYYTVTEQGNPATHDDDYEKIFYVQCNDEACCAKEVTICWDAATNSMVRTENIISSGTPLNCSGDTPDVPSSVFPNHVSSCRLNCWED
jgi:hypothetical protein